MAKSMGGAEGPRRPVGLPGRLSKGAGTHLASWLQVRECASSAASRLRCAGNELPLCAARRGSPRQNCDVHPQEVGNVGTEEAIAWLEAARHPQTQAVLEALRQRHGKTVGHAGKIVDAAFSGELLATKDEKSMRLWRARDGTLLRVVSACPGDSVAFAPNGQNIATGSAKLSRAPNCRG